MTQQDPSVKSVISYLHSQCSRINKLRIPMSHENLAECPDTMQELLQLHLIEDWLLSEISREPSLYPWDTH